MQLDMEQLNALPPADRNRYLALEKLFAMPGWKIVVALAKQNSEAAVQRAAFATSWGDNRLAIGNGYAWNEIQQLETATEKTYATMAVEALTAANADKLSEEHDFE